MDPGLIYVSWDGDGAWTRAASARVRDDEPGLRHVMSALARGNDGFVSWAQRSGGDLVEAASDQGCVRVPPGALGELPALMTSYKDGTGCAVTVGLGPTMAQAGRALRAAKAQGGGRALAWSERVDEQLREGERSAGAAVAEQVEPAAKAEEAVRCAICKGKIRLHSHGGISGWMHDNSTDHYAGMEIHHDAEKESGNPRPLSMKIVKAEPTAPVDVSAPSLAEMARQVASLHVDADRRLADERAGHADKTRVRLADLLRGISSKVAEMRALGRHAPEAARALADVLGAVRDYAATLPPRRAPAVVPDQPAADPAPGVPPAAQPLDKAGVGGAEKGREHLSLPVGAEHNGKVKVRHGDTGKEGWVSVRSGQVLSQTDGHAVSSLHPSTR